MMTDNELNEAVAIKLDDFKPNEHKVGNVILRGNSLSFPYPLYSTDIKAAWEVVEHLRKMELDVEVKAWPMETRKAYSCHIIELCVDKHYFSEAPTAPRAICEAFLKLP